MARRRYSLPLIAAWLLAWLNGASVRNRVFLVWHAVTVPPAATQGSWSDLLDASPTEPGYQLLWHWTRDFQRRASRFLEGLIPISDWCGVDLKTLARTLEGEVLSRASPLALAAGLLGLLTHPPPADSSVSLSLGGLSVLVRMLTARRLPPSHQILRVSGGRIRYDTLVV